MTRNARHARRVGYMTIRRQRIARRMTWLSILYGTAAGAIGAIVLLLINGMTG